MTAANRAANGQDECRHLTWSVDLDTGHAWCARCALPWTESDEGRRSAEALHVAAGRAGAGEQQRVSPELRRYLTGLAGSFRDFGRADIADELLSLLGGPQPDGEAVELAAQLATCSDRHTDGDLAMYCEQIPGHVGPHVNHRIYW